MKNENSKLKLFAIYKTGKHLGNENGKDGDHPEFCVTAL